MGVEYLNLSAYAKNWLSLCKNQNRTKTEKRIYKPSLLRNDLKIPGAGHSTLHRRPPLGPPAWEEGLAMGGGKHSQCSHAVDSPMVPAAGLPIHAVGRSLLLGGFGVLSAGSMAMGHPACPYPLPGHWLDCVRVVTSYICMALARSHAQCKGMC